MSRSGYTETRAEYGGILSRGCILMIGRGILSMGGGGSVATSTLPHLGQESSARGVLRSVFEHSSYPSWE